MYQIDFNHPSSIYFVGIGGISMSGLPVSFSHLTLPTKREGEVSGGRGSL